MKVKVHKLIEFYNTVYLGKLTDFNVFLWVEVKMVRNDWQPLEVGRCIYCNFLCSLCKEHSIFMY